MKLFNFSLHLTFLTVGLLYATSIRGEESSTEDRETHYKNPPRVCVAQGKYNPNKDYFPNKLEIESESFSVEYHSNYKIVTNRKSKEEVVLLQCGTPLPDRQLGNKRKVIEIPVNRIAVLQNSTASYLTLLGYPEVVKVNGSSSAPFLGADGANGALRKPKDRSRGIKFTAPDEVIDEVDVVFTGHYNPAAKHVTVSEGKEKVPLRTTDWLGYYSLFINQEKRANRLIQETRTNYQCISKRMNELMDRHNAPRYRIGWIRVEPQADYNNHTERWIFSTKKYKKGLSGDVGGDFLGNSTTHRMTDLQVAQSAMKE
ncbi:hypothetical protein IWQ62_006343, partial [Dispira parvispora]